MTPCFGRKKEPLTRDEASQVTSHTPIAEVVIMLSSFASTDGDTHSRYDPSHSIFGRPAGHTIPRREAQLTKVSGVIAQLD